MTPCRPFNDELVECALGRMMTPELSVHLATCAICNGALEAWRTRATEMDRVLIRLAQSEPRSGGSERVLARIATSASSPSYLRLVTAALALVILASLIALRARPVRTISVSTWSSPTQCLLSSQADPLLKSVPRLGDGLLEMHLGKEDYAQ
jgi:hypothetical protein